MRSAFLPFIIGALCMGFMLSNVEPAAVEAAPVVTEILPAIDTLSDVCVTPITHVYGPQCTLLRVKLEQGGETREIDINVDNLSRIPASPVNAFPAPQSGSISGR